MSVYVCPIAAVKMNPCQGPHSPHRFSYHHLYAFQITFQNTKTFIKILLITRTRWWCSCRIQCQFSLSSLFLEYLHSTGFPEEMNHLVLGYLLRNQLLNSNHTAAWNALLCHKQWRSVSVYSASVPVPPILFFCLRWGALSYTEWIQKRPKNKLSFSLWITFSIWGQGKRKWQMLAKQQQTFLRTTQHTALPTKPMALPSYWVQVLCHLLPQPPSTQLKL